MEHTSGFRPPGRDFTHAAREAKQGKQDQASRRYQRHMDERFRAREVERTHEEAEETEEE